MAESNLLVEKRQEFAAKSAAFSEVSALINTPEDYSKKEVLEKLGAADAADAKGKWMAKSAEIEALGRDVDTLSIEETKRVHGRRMEQLKEPIRHEIPGSTLSDEPRSFGQLVTDSKDFMGRVKAGFSVVNQHAATVADISLKTLMQTSAGWQPRVGNGDRVVDKVIRPVQVLDFIPSAPTDQFEIAFMEETTRTQNEAELAEAGTYAEDAFVFTRRNSVVRKIGSQIPVTDEQLQDEEGMRSLLDNRLRFGLLARLDQQVLVGDGTPPNLQGLFTVSGIQTQAKGADPAANAIFKAMTLVRITGRAAPDLIVMHGTDWQNIRLAQNAQGDYQFGPPSAVGEDTLWGLRVVQSEALTQGNAIVGSFGQYCQLREKKGIEVAAGYISTQFIEGKITLRADTRQAFVVYRGAAFCKVTGL